MKILGKSCTFLVLAITTHAIRGSKTKALHAVLSVLDWHAISICVAVHDGRCMAVYSGIERRDITLAPPLRDMPCREIRYRKDSCRSVFPRL